MGELWKESCLQLCKGYFDTMLFSILKRYRYRDVSFHVSLVFLTNIEIFEELTTDLNPSAKRGRKLKMTPYQIIL